MKVDIDENGVMIIAAETPMEAFALKSWSSKAEVIFEDPKRMEASYIRGSKLITITSYGMLDKSVPCFPDFPDMF